MIDDKSPKVCDTDAQSLKKTVGWLMVAAWMILIFAFSDQNAASSSEMSGSIVKLAAECIQFFKKLLFQDSTAVDLHLLTYLIRKGAHFFLYMVLGILVSGALCPGRKMTLRFFLLAVLICFLYACSDEVHQIFQSGRSCEFGDVLIDTSGAIVGTCLYHIKKKFNRNNLTV